MMLQIQRSFDREKGVWNITPKGDVDISTASMLRSALDEAYRENKADIILHFAD